MRLEEICEFYNISDSILEYILDSHLQFAGLNHERVVREAVGVYGFENEGRIKESVLKHPPFAGLNHKRVLRQKIRIGRMIGFSPSEVKGILLAYPIQAGCSYKRDLARIDVVRTMIKNGLDIDEATIAWFIKNYIPSPYVNGQRISHGSGDEIPSLLKRASKRFQPGVVY